MATSALDTLYQIDTPEALKDCLNAFLTAVGGTYALATKSREDDLINTVVGDDRPVTPDLYRHYADNLRRAVRSVPVDDDLAAQWQANVSRFAAYKAYHATQRIRGAVKENGDFDAGRAVLHAYNRYQAAEYNTAVARARTGQQWRQFDTDDNRRLFPNIQWLPSRSATPREAHMPFYNRVWAKDDPFWLHNQPGTLWNCKCDWQQTDDPVTDGNPTKTIATPGLDQNPATSGQIFTDTAGYIKKAPKGAESACRSISRDYAKLLAGKNNGITCMVGKAKHTVDFSDKKINNHFAKDLFDKDVYWMKNEILADPQRYFDQSEIAGFKVSDTTHNTNRETLRLKAKTDFFYYYKVVMPDGKPLYLHVGHYKESDLLYLYSASIKPPKDMKTLQ